MKKQFLFTSLVFACLTVFAQVENLTHATAISSSVRLDLRDGFGGRVVRGTVVLSAEEGAVTCDDKAAGTSWDTTKLSEGWHTLKCGSRTEQVCVRNDAGIAFEEGRLTESTTWDSAAVHVIRNDVYVPRGVTLTLSEGAVVKFAEDSRIIVEYGGKISVQGSEEAPVLFAMAEDDSVGGDTDLREEELEPIYSARIYCYETNSWEDNGWLVSSRVVISVLPNLAVKPVRAMRQGGTIRIPVTVSGTRNAPFWAEWQAVDGTAKYGVDFAAKQGKVTWSSTSAGVAYIEIPLVDDAPEGEASFLVRLVRACGANIQTAEAEVALYDNADAEFDALTHATATSTPVRLDLRNDLGGRVVRGTILMYNADGTVLLDGDPLGESWDTTALADGWYELTWGGETAEVAVLNDAAVSLEEGRLTENTTWDNSAVRLVRNDVYIPKGITLTITEGTTVKFAEDSRIIVENGGKLQMNGSEDAYVQFAMAMDDGYAGDTDMRDEEVELPSYSVIYCYSSGTVADNGFVASRGLVVSTTYPSVYLHSALAQEESGEVYLALTLSGTRKSSFYIEWEATDGTATYGEDYALASGKVTWTSTDNGTKYIHIPLVAGNLAEDEENFNVRLVASGGANLADRDATVTIRKTADYVVNNLTWSEGLAEKARLDLREGFGGSIVRGNVGVSQEEGSVSLDGKTLGRNWDTASLADGWYELVCGENAREVVVLNDAEVSLEEGRITANTTWDGTAVHLVRNDVYIPNGKILTLTDGAVVKFTENTRIIVENGGKISVQGSVEAPVQFALATDDTYGGDTDLRDGEMDVPSNSLIYCYNTSNGWTDNGYFALRQMTMNTLPTIAIHNSRAVEHEGFVAIPVTVSGTRKAAFSVDWSAHDNTAKLDTDYTKNSGTLTWSSTDNGTRYIEIPLVSDENKESLEDFTVTLDASYATNVGNALSTVSIFENDAILPADAVYACTTYDYDEPTDLDERTDLFSRLAREVETLRYSTEWTESDHASAVRVTSQLDEEGIVPSDLYVSEPGETDGTVDWNTYSLGTGRYLLAHETLDERGGLLERLETNFFINREVIVHEGRLTGDETWDASFVHVVRGNVIVPAGVLLTISDGAIVKFQDGCGIVAKLGSVVDCKGATFTHIADDSVGGDTNLDGLGSVVSYDAYTLGGDGTVRMDSACKLLCKSATLPSGTLRQNLTLSGNLVYRATGNLTIASGYTLTIEPGAVLKFDAGQGITVSSGAILEALGTRAQPILFTSIKDDAHGGDTNQDGKKSFPTPGDWKQITNNGTAKMEYCSILYPEGSNNQGGLFNTGILEFQNGEIAHTVYDTLRSSGNATISNSVFQDTSMGFAPSGGSNLMVNCIIYDATTCVRWPSATFVNCIFAHTTEFVDTSFGTGMIFQNCVFWNDRDFGPQECYATGSNGNLWADPLFNDPDNGDFTLKATSPCIDAGDGSVAPELDYWGKPRMNYTKINDTGVASENGCVPDIGIYEFPGTGGGEVPDLQLNWVRGPAIAASGEKVTLSWQIENAGQTTIQGTWRDSVSAISADEELGNQIIELGISSGYEMLAPGEQKTIIRQCRIPAMMPGNWRFAVTVNDNLDIYERNYLNNRQESEEAIEIQVDEWQAGKYYALAGGEDIALTTGEQSILELVSQQSDALTIRVGDGFLPTDAHFTSSARALEDGRKLLVVSETANECAFLRIANDSATPATFGLKQVELSELIFELVPNSLPAQEVATLSFILLDAVKVKQVVLKQGEVTIIATGVSTDDQGRTVATFNLSEVLADTYDLEVTAENGMVYSVSEAITVEESAKSAQLEAWLDLPASVREGRQYIGYVCYKNSGNADRNAPVFRVIGEGNTKVKAKLSDEPDEAILLYGTGANPVNVLRAGEEGRVPFYFTFTGNCSLKFDTMTFPDEEYPASATFATWKELETAVHKAALRLHERGTEETNFNSLRDFAEKMTVSEFSGICGHAYHAKSHAVLPKVTVIADTTIDGQAMRFTEVTDNDGYFCFDALPGEVEYTLALNFAETEGEYKVNTMPGKDVTALEILGIPWGSIDGYVCMKGGQPIAGDYSVELWSEDGVFALMRKELPENASFEFRDLVDGTYCVKVVKGEDVLVNSSTPVVVDSSNSAQHIVVEIESLGRIYGRLLTKDGEVCGEDDMQMVARGENGGVYHADVAEDGSWEIAEIPSGAYRLEIEAENWTLAEDAIAGLLEEDDLDAGMLTLVPKAFFIPFPSIGAGTLEVECQFTMDASTDGYGFSWDFDGDGIADSTEPEPEWTYTELGEHEIALTLTTPDGEEKECRQTVTVIEPIENVLYDDVILIHEMENPPYEFVSWDGTTLVMREVGEYPVKPVENAKMLFKFPDGDVVGVKILTSRKYGDCYYLTVDDATLTDVFKSFSFELAEDDFDEDASSELRARPKSEYKYDTSTALDFEGLSIDITHGRRTPFLTMFHDSDNDVFAFEYTDGYWLKETFNFKNVSVGLSYGGKFAKKPTYKYRKTVWDIWFHLGGVPCQALADFFWNVSISANDFYTGSFAIVEEVGYRATRVVKGKHQEVKEGFWPTKSISFEGDAGEWKWPSITGQFEFGLDVRLLLCGASIKGKAEVSLLEFSLKFAAEVGFTLSPEYRKVFAGVNVTLVAKAFNASLDLGFLNFNFTGLTLPLYSRELARRTWIWGLPREEFDWTSTPYDTEKGFYTVYFTTTGPLVQEYATGDEWFKTIYYPCKSIDRRLWNFGDGGGEVVHSGGTSSESFAIAFQGQASHQVSLVPQKGALGKWVSGIGYSAVVAPDGTIQRCPKCGHVYGMYNTTCKCECHGYIIPPDGDNTIPTLQSCDPNEIVGPRGVGDPATQRLVAPGEWLDYTVYFENKATADAAAQEVWVDLDLDESLVDVSSFQLGTVAFGNQQVNTLSGKALGKFAVTQDGTPWQVRGTVTYDASGGAAQWYLRSYDPANAEGGYWPAVTTAGFLPPNDDTHAGEGYVTFRVKVREDAPVGRRIDCKATIVFDHNQPITTSPAWFNWIYDGGTRTANPPNVLAWDEVDGAEYDVVIWTGAPELSDAASEVVAEFTGLTSNTLRVPSGLAAETTYYWQVTTNVDGVATAGAVWSFELGERLAIRPEPGWNLVSLPFPLDNYSEQVMLSRTMFEQEDDAYVRPLTLGIGRSYWLYQGEMDSVTLELFPSSSAELRSEDEGLELNGEWTLAGSVGGDADLADYPEITRAFEWRDGTYRPADSLLEKGQGYWVGTGQGAKYAVVDLSDGPNAERYSVRYTDDDPDLSDDTCRTTELWLRWIPAGSFQMGSVPGEKGRTIEREMPQHQVRLTHGFYIGVFECTQKQWELVMGYPIANLRAGAYAPVRPAEGVSYDLLRGTEKAWPQDGHAVEENSFMGRLRAKTGLTFDLPTEAQWEYACRARTTTALNSGEDLTNWQEDPAMDAVGRYLGNGGGVTEGYEASPEVATAPVGSYLSNAWGLFDCHGNVWEWCLDWWEPHAAGDTMEDAIDPAGPLSGENGRVLRGGGFTNYAAVCRAAYQFNNIPSSRNGNLGFRILFLP